MRLPSVLLRAACAAALLLVLAPAGAATRDYYFARLGREYGLRQNSVSAMVQDPQGFVWVGTQGGLHRYDGQRYVSFRHDPRDAASLPDSYVTALSVDARQTLWVGTNSEYVAALDLRSGMIRRYALPGDPQGARQVGAVLPQAGRVWVGTREGLQRLDPATGAHATVLRLPERGRRDVNLQALVPAAGGGVWYATPVGLYRVNPDGRARWMPGTHAVRSLLADADGTLWIGQRDGLWRLDRSASAPVRAWPEGSAVAEIRALARAPDGALWLSVSGQGLARLDPRGGSLQRLRENDAVEASLPEDLVSALMVDRGGLLWVGGQFRGVALTDTRGARFKYLVDTAVSTPESAAADDSVRALMEDRDGSLWIGTDSSKLLHYLPGPDLFRDETRLLDAGAQRGRVTAFATAADGTRWMATQLGLRRFDPARRRIEAVPLPGFDPVSLRSLAIDRQGELWLGTDGEGLLRYRPRDGRVLNYPHSDGDASTLAHPMVHAVLEDRRGRIWVATGDGLDLLDRDSGRITHFRHRVDDANSLPGNLVRALHESPDGTLWVGTHAGLSRVIERPGLRGAQAFGFVHPLAESLGDQPVPVVFSIAERPAGWLWLGTDSGLVRFDTTTERSRIYGLADGLQDLEFNGGAVASLSGGRLAFGGVRGVNVFEPVRLHDSGLLPPVRLLSARIGADAPGDGGILWQPRELDMPGSADILRLRIGALDYSPAARLRYRYRMDGFDKGWVDNGAQQDITYTQLPPGEYVFRAQAGTQDGVWGEDELRLPVHVAPPLWRHPLTLAIACLLAAGAAGAALWRLRMRRQRELGYFAQIREREERLKLALWASGEQFWDYDLAHRQLHRMRVDDQVGPSPDIGVQSQVEVNHDIHPDDLPRVLEELRRHLRGDAALFLSEHRVRAGEGLWAWVRARGRVVERDAAGRATRVAGTARDITASRSAERERRVSSEVLRSMAEAVAVIDREFTFVSVNPAFAKMTGYSDTEVIGRPTRVLDSLQHDGGVYAQLRADLERVGRWAGELWQRRKDGSEFLCWLQASAVEDSGEAREHYVAVLTDITDQKKAEQELRYLANFDALTGLPNRACLSDRLSRAIVGARRRQTKIALLFLDLDRFKDINDSLGHAAGDRILRAAASRLQQVVGPHQTVARLGGDEFTVVLENVEGPEQAEQIAREIIVAFGEPLDFDGRHDLAISPSIGISLYPDHALIPTDLLKHADTAMYQAKALGRRTFMRYHEGMDVEIRRRATLSASLRKVIDRGELRLAFQPRLSVPHQRITGVEALLRWHSVEHGEVSPSQFIPLAEESGVILEIGEWVLSEACAVLHRWRQRGLLDLTMAVNVSALQLQRGGLPELVARVLHETHVPAACLELELTESVLMANAQETGDTLQALRDLGVGLAVDDFGTGYSSLAYLKRLPITTLKIDKEFIGDITHDADDEAITSTVIAMAHSLELNVVAEGVETVAQMQFLREHRCDEIQGFWLSPPLDAAECASFIRAWTPHDAGLVAVS